MIKYFLTCALFGYVLIGGNHAMGATVDFENAGSATDPAGLISAAGVDLSFDNFFVTEEFNASNGFGTADFGANTVNPAYSSVWGGKALTIDDAPFAQIRQDPTGIITFSSAVTGLSFYIADIDAFDDHVVSIYDASNVLLASIDVSGTGMVVGDAVATFFDFSNYSNVGKIEIYSTDVIGLDNLSFVAVPLPASVVLLLSAMAGVASLGVLRRRAETRGDCAA